LKRLAAIAAAERFIARFAVRGPDHIAVQLQHAGITLCNIFLQGIYKRSE
jgi:hypothetical protein